MSAKVSPIPQGYHTITPHIVVNDARKAADFYKQAFGAEVRPFATGPDGKVMHTEVKIGDSTLMLNDEFPEWHVLSPTSTKADTCCNPAFVCGGCGQGFCNGGRPLARKSYDAAAGPVLGRSLRQAEGPVRPHAGRSRLISRTRAPKR